MVDIWTLENGDNMTLSLDTPSDKQKQIAKRLRDMRLYQKLKQTTVAERSSVACSTLKRFEHTGEISLASLLRIALVLGALDDFDLLFRERETVSIENWIQPTTRKRGRA